MWLMMVHTLPVASRPWNGLQLILVVVVSPQVVQVPVLARTMTQRVTLMTTKVSVLEAILGRQVGQREDTACDEDGVDVSVGVDVDAVVGVGVHGQGVNLYLEVSV